MEQNKSDKVLAFDTLYTTNHIQMLKIFHTYLDGSMQKTLAILIKYMEFQYTISFFQQQETKSSLNSLPFHPTTNLEWLDELSCYCSDSEKAKFKQMKNFQNTFQMFQDMQPLIEMMSSLSSSEDSSAEASPENSDSAGNKDMMSQMLKNMLTPEQQVMFELFSQNETKPGGFPL